MSIKAFLSGLPGIIQYLAVFGLVMLILYFCLTLTRWLGRNRGKQQSYDDPEAYDKSVPDLFASTAFRRKKKDEDAAQRDEQSD